MMPWAQRALKVAGLSSRTGRTQSVTMQLSVRPAPERKLSKRSSILWLLIKKGVDLDKVHLVGGLLQY
eukprot:6247002-Amphidinium_carterae.1